MEMQTCVVFLFDFFLLYIVVIISVCTKSWICNIYKILSFTPRLCSLYTHRSPYNIQFPIPFALSPIEEYTQYNLMKNHILCQGIMNQQQINHLLELQRSLDLPPQLYDNFCILRTSDGEMQQREAPQKTNEVLTSSNVLTQMLIFLYICALTLMISIYKSTENMQ